jgi:hypothetical protein
MMLSFRQGITCLMLMIAGFSPILSDYGGPSSDCGGRLADKPDVELETTEPPPPAFQGRLASELSALESADVVDAISVMASSI